MPSLPFEKMLLERIESPVPDSIETPARTLKAMMLPAPAIGAADRVVRGVVADDDAVDLVAQGALPVMSVPM